MEKSYKAFAVVCILASIALAITISAQNAIFMASFANGDWLGIGLGACGICIDLGMFVFPTLAGLYYARDNLVKAIAFGFLTAFCFCISITSSWTHDLNKTNAIINEALSTSGANVRQEALFNTANSSIQQLKDDIKTLKATKDKEIAASVEGLKSQKAALPRDYITQKNNIQTKINKTAAQTKADIEQQISQKESELKQRENDLKSASRGFENLGKDINTTKGAYSLAKWINPKNPDEAIGFITLGKGIILGVMAIAFSVAIGGFLGHGTKGNIFKAISKKFKHSPTPPQIRCPKMDNVTAINDRPKNKIGFDTQIQSTSVRPDNSPDKINGVSNAKIKAYIEYMYNNMIADKYSPGITTIAKSINLKENKCKLIYGYLKHSGVIKSVTVEGKKTTEILKPKNDINL